MAPGRAVSNRNGSPLAKVARNSHAYAPPRVYDDAFRRIVEPDGQAAGPSSTGVHSDTKNVPRSPSSLKWRAIDVPAGSIDLCLHRITALHVHLDTGNSTPEYLNFRSAELLLSAFQACIEPCSRRSADTARATPRRTRPRSMLQASARFCSTAAVATSPSSAARMSIAPS